MRTIQVGQKKIVLYQSIKEFPIELSKKFNAYLLQDIGIGNSIEDVDEHLAKTVLFLQADKKHEAIEEAQNLRYNLFSMLHKWHFGTLSFACLIKSVDGKELTDYTTEGLLEVTKELSDAGLTVQMVEDYVQDVKKNLIPNENSTFQQYSGMI